MMQREKDACNTCKDAVVDTIASHKADLGIMHETVRIKTVECDKLNQYCNSVERALVNAREGRTDKIQDLVYHQGDHIRIAQISKFLKDINDTICTQSLLLKKIIKNNNLDLDENFVTNQDSKKDTGCPKESVPKNNKPL